MRKSLLALTALIVATALAGALVAAGRSSGGAASKVNLTLALEASGDTALGYQKWIDGFNRTHPNIHVNLQTIASGDAYNQAILGQVAGGVPPDVFLLDGGLRTQQFAHARALVPLDGLAARAKLKLANFKPALLSSLRVGGKLYGIPKDFSSTGLFYNKALLQKAGVTPPRTWGQFRADAKALTGSGVYGLGMYPQINYFLAWIVAAGGNFVTANGIRKFYNPRHVRAVAFLVSLFDRDKSAASPQMTGSGWDGEMLGTQKAAMVFGGTWIPGAIKGSNPDVNVGAVLMPPNQQRGSVLYATGWVVSSKSKYPQQAMQLISWMASDRSLLSGYAGGFISIPPTASALKKLEAQRPDDATLKVAEIAAERGIPFGWLDPKFVDAYNNMLADLISNPSKSPVQAIAALGKQFGLK